MSTDGPPTELLANALQLMSQEWTKLSQGEDPSVQASPELDVITQRLTALLLARLIAVVHDRDRDAPQCFPDYSTVTICRTLLVQPELWPAAITATVVQELQEYVGKIVEHYYPTGIVPYHNAEHAFHVTLSMNKLLDMMLSRKFGEAVVPPSFGLRYQPVALFSMVFSALIHDVEHTGVANRILASEDNPLAIQYNDQSVAENRSLFVAFDEFLSPVYENFRKALVPEKEDYHLLRKYVINLVLHTDIASPEKTQLGKSKWKEAFFDVVQRRRSMENANANKNVNSAGTEQAPNAPKTSSSGTSLASLGIRSGSHQGEGFTVTSEEQSLDTMLTESDEDTRDDSQEPVPEQAPAPSSARSRRNLPNRNPVAAAAPPESPKPRPVGKKRLGIRRSMDLSGEVLDPYASSEPDDADRAALVEADQPDELKMTVVMETLMQAADVAHNLQSWDHMVEWSCRLYLELRRAYIQNRGPDVSQNWFANQVGFLEMYLEPLAKKLEIVGVFGSMVGPSFARIVRASRDRWLLDGMEVTQAVIDAGEEWYPAGESVEPLPEFSPRHGSEKLGAMGGTNGSSDGQDGTAEQEASLKELKELKEKLEEATELATQGQRQADEHYQTTVALQETLDEKESAIHALRQELAATKGSNHEESELAQETKKKMVAQEEELKRAMKEYADLQAKLREQEEIQEGLKRKLLEQDGYKEKLQELQERIQAIDQQRKSEVEAEVRRQHELKMTLEKKEEELQRQLKQQEQMEKLLRAQAEARKLQDEGNLQGQFQSKPRDPMSTGVSSSHVSRWQTFVLILMGLALLWTTVRAPILNNLCAPASLGTTIAGVDTAVYESPWFVADDLKKTAFSICGARSRVRIENIRGKLSWTVFGNDGHSTEIARNFYHATIESDRVVIVDKRGAERSIGSVPWYLPS